MSLSEKSKEKNKQNITYSLKEYGKFSRVYALYVPETSSAVQIVITTNTAQSGILVANAAPW